MLGRARVIETFAAGCCGVGIDRRTPDRSPRSGDVRLADLGDPKGPVTGFARPVVMVTAQQVLDQGPSVVHVVPLASRIRGYRSEVLADLLDV